MSFTADLVTLIEGGGFSLTYGTNLFKGPKAKIPDGAGPFVSIIRSGGRGGEGTHNSTNGPAYERPSAQIVTRALNYDAAEVLADSLYSFMQPVRDRFINGVWWRSITVGIEPFELPPDDKERARFAFNIDCVKRVSASTSI